MFIKIRDAWGHEVHMRGEDVKATRDCHIGGELFVRLELVGGGYYLCEGTADKIADDIDAAEAAELERSVPYPIRTHRDDT